jgi:hypothetical protein
LLLRIWENTFNFRDSNLNLPSFEEKNFLALAKKFIEVSPYIRRTASLDKMIHEDLLSPQLFDSLIEYDNYNFWYFINFFGDKVEHKQLRAAI